MFSWLKRLFWYTPQDAWYETGLEIGYNEKQMTAFKCGQVAKYSCGCDFQLTPVGGVFGNLPIPPPPRCLRHNAVRIGCKFPEEWVPLV